MTNPPPPEMNRIVEIAGPIARRIAEDFHGTTEPQRVWAEHTGALALLLATLLEQLDPTNEAAARTSFDQAVDVFLAQMRAGPTRPRKP